MNRTKVRKSNPAVKAIIQATFPSYRGRTVSVDASGAVGFYDTNWGGGTKNTYRAVTYRVDQGQLVITDTDRLHAPAPWVNPIEGKRVEVPEGVAVVEHSIFCGKDCGITIYVNMRGGQIAGYLS